MCTFVLLPRVSFLSEITGSEAFASGDYSHMPHENGQHFWTFWLKSARQKVWKNEVEMAEAGQCVGRVQARPRILQSLQMALTSERIAFQLNKQKVKGLALLVSGLGGRDWHGLLPERAFNGGITVGIWSTGVVPPSLSCWDFVAKLNWIVADD